MYEVNYSAHNCNVHLCLWVINIREDGQAIVMKYDRDNADLQADVDGCFQRGGNGKRAHSYCFP